MTWTNDCATSPSWSRWRWCLCRRRCPRSCLYIKPLQKALLLVLNSWGSDGAECSWERQEQQTFTWWCDLSGFFSSHQVNAVGRCGNEVMIWAIMRLEEWQIVFPVGGGRWIRVIFFHYRRFSLVFVFVHITWEVSTNSQHAASCVNVHDGLPRSCRRVQTHLRHNSVIRQFLQLLLRSALSVCPLLQFVLDLFRRVQKISKIHAEMGHGSICEFGCRACLVLFNIGLKI